MMQTVRSQPAPLTALVIFESSFVIVAFQVILGRYVLFDLFGSTGDPSILDTGPEGNRAGESNLLNLVPLLLVYFGSFILFIPRRAYTLLIDRRHIPMIVFLAVVLLSPVWSDITAVSLRRAIGLLGSTAFGAYVALAFPPLLGMRLTAYACAIFCALCLFVAVAIPSIGTHTDALYSGLWNGLAGHKNSFARDVVICACVFAIYLRSKDTWFAKNTLMACALGLCIVLLVGAWSAGGLIAFALIFILYILLRAMAGSGKAFLPAIFIGVLFFGFVLILTLYYFDNILELLGKDPTLTGRTEIWAAAMKVGAERPFLGSGYGAFWVGASAEQVYDQLNRGLQDLGAAHSRFLDIWLELGFLGLAVLIWVFFEMLRNALNAIAADRAPLNMAPLLFLAMATVFSVAGGGLAEHGEMLWIVFVMGWCWLATRRLPISTSRLGENGVIDPGASSRRARRRAKPGDRYARNPAQVGARWQ